MPYQENFVKIYDYLRSEKYYQETVEKLDEIFSENDVKTVLDVGCGTGRIPKLLNDKGYKVIGIDKSKNMIEYARKKYPKLEFHVGDVKEFSLEKYDAVIAMDSVLSYVQEDFEKALENMDQHATKILVFDIAFTENLIPNNFNDNFGEFKEVSMKRKGDKLISDIEIKSQDVHEIHKHHIVKEEQVVNTLEKLGYTVKTRGNNREEHENLKVIAFKN